MSINNKPGFKRNPLALAVLAVLMPNIGFAIDIAQAPPGSVEPYVAPNVIISVDDSGSMDYCLSPIKAGGEGTRNCEISWDTKGNATKWANVIDQKVPNADGSWPANARRINVLKYALAGYDGVGGVFRDKSAIPDTKIRIAWQAMWNNGNSPGVGAANSVKSGGTTYNSTAGANNVDSTSSGVNSMKILNDAHRNAFLSFASGLSANNGTPSHWMFKQADAYMRRPLSEAGPWAAVPGTVTNRPYLGCRRNYHIMMTDGRWNTVDEDLPETNRGDKEVNLMLPDGVIYGGPVGWQREKTALYRSTADKTLADWAFYSWATPLQNLADLTGAPVQDKEYLNAPAFETFTNAAGDSATMDQYWNPKYNPATWAHMVTYTIGFSQFAYKWDDKNIQAPTAKLPFGYDGGLPKLANGSQKWPNLTTTTQDKNALDLWHAALNGRGRFYAVEKGQDLERAFREIFGKINSQTEPQLASSATSGSNTSRNDVGRFIASYEPQNAWKGFVKADILKNDGTFGALASWGGKNTADKLDDLPSIANRVIFSWSDVWNASTKSDKGGISFGWAADESLLSTGQKSYLGLDSSASGVTVATSGSNVINYLRGDRTLEGSDTTGYSAAKPFRERKSRQGDIVNSAVWYAGAPASNYSLKGYASYLKSFKNRTPMIYVGGNDGMLHGFSATDGEEKIAYVPKGAIPTVKRLSEPAYNNGHQYFVDGSPMTGDVDVGVGIQDPEDPGYSATYVPNWRTMLVGTMGRGGKGYFVLDVTNPAPTDVSGVPGFTTANAQKLAVVDRTIGIGQAVPNCSLPTLSTDQVASCTKQVAQNKDIGHITSDPVLDETNPMRTSQIVRLNNNRWAVVFGNGYNSENARPALLIQYLDGDKELVVIPATNDAPGSGYAVDNGLSAPRLIDLNGDGRYDIVYAGDNNGNMWKFDLTNVEAARWKVAFSGVPLFTAKGPLTYGAATRGTAQPISVAPTVRANDRKMIVGSGATKKTVSVGGMMVAFGTGRNLTQNDPANSAVQTFYSVLDNTRYRVVSSSLGNRLEVHPGAGVCTPVPDSSCIPAPAALGSGVVNAKLAEQKITELSGGNFGSLDASSAANNLTVETWSQFNGWYMDFVALGERSLKNVNYYDGSNILALYSQVPASGTDPNIDPNVETCTANKVSKEVQFRTLINVMDGKRPSIQLVDAMGTGTYDAGENNNVSRVKVAGGSHDLLTKKDFITDIDKDNNPEKLLRMPEQSLRPSWRQLK